MKKILKFIALNLLLSSSCLFARDEIFLSMPAGGTGYLIKIIENIADYSVIPPTTSSNYVLDFYKYFDEKDVVIIGHLFDSVLYNFLCENTLPSTPKLILMRDPRDIVLSAIDLIDCRGTEAWPYLPGFADNESWRSLTLEEKITLLVSQQRIDATKTPLTWGLEHAKLLCEFGFCTVVKYEDLSFNNEDSDSMKRSIQEVATFLGEKIDSDEAYEIASKAWGAPKNEFDNLGTFRTGHTYRYRTEVNERQRKLLDKKLRKYIQYFGYES